MLPEWVHDELLNWSAWLSAGSRCGPGPVQMASAERGYIREASGYVDPDPPIVTPDARRAEQVQRVYLRMLDFVARRVIDAEYPERRQSGRDYGIEAAARWARVSPDQYRSALARAGRTIEREIG